MAKYIRPFCVRLRTAATIVMMSLSSGVPADDKVTYDDHVAPIFRQRCSSCHSPTSKKADLDVTTYLNLMQGGASGAAIEPGDAASSYLFSLVNHDAEPYMPQNADKLPDTEIDLLRKWIDGGALENKGSKAAKPKAKKSVAVEVVPGVRPEVIPLPPRMVLEPFYKMPKPTMARSLATSPWAPLVAIASQRQVLLYNTTTLELVGVYPFPDGQPNVVRFSRDGRLLIAGGGRPAASGRVVVWDITTGERITEVGNELDAVLAADISADHKLVALGGPQRIVRVYSTETGELQYEIAKHTDWVLAVEFSPDGVLLATADRSNGLYVWEAHTGRDYLTLNGHAGAINGISWRGDSNVLASGSEDGTVRLWEPENGAQVANWNAKSAVLALEFARDGRLVTCGRDQVVRVWDQAGKALVETAPLGDVAVSATFCDESLRAFAGSWAGVVQAYNVQDAAVIGALATNPPALEERLAAAQQALPEKSAAAAPLVAAAQQAEAMLAAVQATFTSAQSDVGTVQAKVDQAAAKANELTQMRASLDAERTKVSNELVNLQAAQPAIAEALRHLTEALGKLPQDAELAALQQKLTEQLNGGEARAKAHQLKLAELAAAVQAAEAQRNEVNASFEATRKELEAAVARVDAARGPLENAQKAATDARQAAQAAESAVAQQQQAVTRWTDEIAFRDLMAGLQAKLAEANKLAEERQAELDRANEQLTAAKASADAVAAKRAEAAQGVEQLEAEIRQARGIK